MCIGWTELAEVTSIWHERVRKKTTLDGHRQVDKEELDRGGVIDSIVSSNATQARRTPKTGNGTIEEDSKMSGRQIHYFHSHYLRYNTFCCFL